MKIKGIIDENCNERKFEMNRVYIGIMGFCYYYFSLEEIGFVLQFIVLFYLILDILIEFCKVEFHVFCDGIL